MSEEQEVLVIETSVVDVVELAGDVIELVEVIEPQTVVIEPPAEIEVVEIAAEVIELIEVAEQGLPGPPGRPGDESMPYAKRIDFVGDSLIYKGEAQPGTDDADPAWRISRITLTGDDATEQWANGSAEFVHVWIARGSYDYV